MLVLTPFVIRPLLPSQLIKEREVELRDLSSLYTTTNSVHKSSCIENYYQCGLQNTRQNMLLELFSQIINESCYNQLRTKVRNKEMVILVFCWLLT